MDFKLYEVHRLVKDGVQIFSAQMLAMKAGSLTSLSLRCSSMRCCDRCVLTSIHLSVGKAKAYRNENNLTDRLWWIYRGLSLCDTDVRKTCHLTKQLPRHCSLENLFAKKKKDNVLVDQHFLG